MHASRRGKGLRRPVRDGDSVAQVSRDLLVEHWDAEASGCCHLQLSQTAEAARIKEARE